MTELKASPENGTIQIADEVIAIIAGTAALEIDGVIPTSVNGMFSPNDIAEKLGKKNLAKGVKVTSEGNDVALIINLLINHGCKIKDVSLEVQKRVKTAVETMTGLNVTNVDVIVSGIKMEKERPVKDEAHN